MQRVEQEAESLLGRFAVEPEQLEHLLLHLLIGLMYIIVGFFIIDAPVEGAAGLTLVVSVFLIVGGLFRIISSTSSGAGLFLGVVSALIS